VRLSLQSVLAWAVAQENGVQSPVAKPRATHTARKGPRPVPGAQEHEQKASPKVSGALPHLVGPRVGHECSVSEQRAVTFAAAAPR